MRLHLRSLLATPVLLAAVALPQQAGPLHAAAAASPTPAWTQATSGPQLSNTSVQPFSGTAVGDLLNNGQQEVVAAFSDGCVYVYAGVGGGVVAGWPKCVGQAIHATPTLADLAGNGQLEVIVSTEDNCPSTNYSTCPFANHGGIYVWYPNGTAYPGWPQRSTPVGSNFKPAFFATVAVGDIHGDGGKELVATGWDENLYAWDTTGHIQGGFPQQLYDSIWGSPTLVDIEHANRLDIVVGADSSGGGLEPCPAGASYWAVRGDGSRVPGWGPRCLPGEVPWASNAAEDLDRTGSVDIVNGTGHNFGAADGKQVNTFTESGAFKGGWPAATGGENFGSPAVGDLYGNGGREVVEASEDGKVYAWNGSGQPLAGWPVSPGQGGLLSSVSIAPVDGSGHNGVWVVANGTLFGYTASGAAAVSLYLGGDSGVSAPTIANLGDGHLSAVFTTASNSTDTAWKTWAVPIPGTGASLPAGAWPTFRGNMRRTGTNLGLFPPPPPPPPGSKGYWMVASDGGIFSFGAAPFYGSMGGRPLVSPIVGMAHTPDSGGYWMVAGDGGIFSFGDAQFHGSMGGHPLVRPIVGIATTPSGNGYWMVASDGGIFSFGDAQFYGSMGGHPLVAPIVGIAPTPTGHGYWMVASDGGIFSFGDAPFLGSMGGHPLNQPVVGITTNGAAGYWMVATDGGIFSFGSAPFYGSMGGHPLNAPINGMAATAGGTGYRMVASDGGIFDFGTATFLGSMGGHPLVRPIVGMTAFG